jgi:predicted ArsR family transcriptional regulator
MGEKEWDPLDVFDLFGDGLTRRILVLASEHPMSADELARSLDTSHPTIYRRLNALIEYDLVTEHQQIDAEGNHYKMFETTLNRIAFEIDDGGYNIDIKLRQNLVDQFDDLWSDLGESHVGESARRGEKSDRPNRRHDTHHG